MNVTIDTILMLFVFVSCDTFLKLNLNVGVGVMVVRVLTRNACSKYPKNQSEKEIFSAEAAISLL